MPKSGNPAGGEISDQVGKPKKPDKIVSQYLALVQSATHLQYAINGEAGAPEIASTPYFFQMVNYRPVFYVLGSMLSGPARALCALASRERQTQAKPNPLPENAPVSLLVCDSLATTKDPYAIARLSLSAGVRTIARDAPEWQRVIDGLTERHGDTVSILSTLQDFHCFSFHPVQGRFVKGFGKAFELSGEHLQNWVHLRQS